MYSGVGLKAGCQMVRMTRALHQYDLKGCCKLIIRYCICCLSRYGPMTTRAARKTSRDFRTTKTLVSKQRKISR